MLVILSFASNNLYVIDFRFDFHILETELGNLTDKCGRLQQDFENQLSSCQQLEMEVAKKSTQLHEKEDIEIKLR